MCVGKYRQLLKISRLSKIEEIFFKLLCGLRFSPKSFYFFFNRIARYAQSKESRNLSSEILQTTYKAIFRSCLYFLYLSKLYMSTKY